MEETTVIIVGQGLAGTWLSYWFADAGISFRLIDQSIQQSASLKAAGLINPVTGRRMVTTWMIDELMPFAANAYRKIGDFLGETVLEDTSVIDFFPSVQMLQAFQKRYEEDPRYLSAGINREQYAEWFRYEFGWGAIHPCLLVDVNKLLVSWRKWLEGKGWLSEAVYDPSRLTVNEKGLTYADIQFSYLIFCDGKSSAESPFFANLPFALNKGEGLLVEIIGLPPHQVFKKGLSLVPYGENVFWLGSTYEWTFQNDQPTTVFRQQAESWLTHFIKQPYRILEHFAALRPATLERRPFVGFHPQYPSIGILNGLGTKGCSLAPYFAHNLVSYLQGLGEIHPLADVRRFEKILGRPS